MSKELFVRVLVKPGKIKSRNVCKYEYSEEATKSNDVLKLIPHRLLGESSRGFPAQVLQVLYRFDCFWFQKGAGKVSKQTKWNQNGCQGAKGHLKTFSEEMSQ